MKTRNKLIGALTLILCMFILTSNGVNANGYTPPVFLSADFAKDTFESGEPVTVNIYSENGTNEIDYVFVQIEHNDTGRRFSKGNDANVEGETEITFDLAEAPRGEYVIRAVSLTDSAEVSEVTYNPGASFELVGEPTDTEKPVFHNAFFEKEQYAPGDEVVLKIKATDEHSKIKHVFGGIQHLTAENNTFSGFSIEEDGYQIIRFQLPENALSGDYGIKHLLIEDNSGNQLILYDVNGHFHVTGGKADTDAPTLKNITIDKEQFKLGEQATININAEDESGVESVFVQIRHKETNARYNGFASLHGDTFIYNTNLPQNAPLGEYELHAILLTDNLGNKQSFFNFEPRIEFEVIE